MITATAEAVKLVHVGQIAFHGLIRAPARVRAISWILPDAQRRTLTHIKSLGPG